MSERQITQVEQNHYDAVMANYGRVELENELDTIKKQLDSIQQRMSKVAENPNMPSQEEIEASKVVSEEPAEPMPIREKIVTPEKPSPQVIIISTGNSGKPEKWSRGKKAMAAVLGVVALAGAIFVGSKLDDDNKIYNTTVYEQAENPGTPVDPRVQGSPTPPVASAPKRSNELTESELKYRNIDTGSDQRGLIGNFNIDRSNPEQSKENFFRDIRHNPQELGFWQACTDQGSPSYQACAENPGVLRRAETLSAQYATMDPAKKGAIAEDVIEKFNKMNFGGVIEHSGPYNTIAIKDGNFVPQTQSRANDEWLKFTAIDQNGKRTTFYVRSCGQIVEPAPKAPIDTITPVPPAPRPQPPIGEEPEKPTPKPKPAPKKPKKPVTPPPTVVTPPPATPPPAGKDHRQSPVTDDRNHPEEEKRPNIPAPPVAIQPPDAPAVDPYEPPVVGNPDRPDVVADPRPPENQNGAETPASSPDTSAPNTGIVTGP
jgi:hypothetical protein